jgi:cytochrome d ubiquinol oxidase subunit II
MSALEITWFGIIAVLVVGYAILDGFDLGVGFWHFFTKRDEERRKQVAAIAPVWDGNEVWLVGAGAALFAAFPLVYATVFSGMYLALMLVLMALIARGVSLEMGAREPAAAARGAWDFLFALGSTLAALLFGVAFGNILQGLPLDAEGNYTGTFLTLLNPFAILVGLLNLAMLATHGALYLVMKLEGEHAERVKRWAQGTWVAYLPLALIVMGMAGVMFPHLLRNYQALPWLWLLPAATVAAIVTTGILHARGRERGAFIASSGSIALLLLTAVTALFPNLVPAQGDPALSLTIARAASSPLTLKTMLIVFLMGMPLVLGYTFFVYRIFRGKVQDDVHY